MTSPLPKPRGQEASRRAAQHALLAALRQLCPQPLAELRDGLPPMNLSAAETDERPPRSAARAARIREAQRRVQALVLQPGEDRLLVAADLDAWAARWHLDALRDLAPHLMAYWRRRPAAGARFYFPKIRPIVPSPRTNERLDIHDIAQPLLADADLESEDDFLLRARAHYQEHQKHLATRPHHRRRQLQRHVVWYVRSLVQGMTADQIAEAANDGTKDAPDVSTIRKGIAEFARLLHLDGN